METETMRYLCDAFEALGNAIGANEFGVTDNGLHDARKLVRKAMQDICADSDLDSGE